MKKRVLILVALLAPLVWLVPHLNNFIYGLNSDYTDLAISHLPNAVYLIQSITTWKTIPLWSDTIYGGYPFASDPLSGLWYPPGWLVLVYPSAFLFNLIVLLHLFWGGLGIFRWLDRQGYSLPGALFGAILFESMPKVLAHFAAGHVTLVYAISWTGWLLFAEDVRQNSKKGFGWVLPGMVLGMILLADVRWGVYAGLLWIGYGIFLLVERKIIGNKPIRTKEIIRIVWGWSKGFILAFVAGFIAAAPLLLPLSEFITLSTRKSMTSLENLALSLPFSNLLGLFFPPNGVNAELVLYPGIVSWIIILLMLPNPNRPRWRWFWVLVGVASLLLALGSNLSFASVLYSLPGFSLLRVPSRALFITGLAFAVLGSEGIQTIIDRVEKKLPVTFVLVVTLAAFVTMFALGVMIAFSIINTGFFWAAFCAWGTGLLVFLFSSNKINLNLFSVLIILMLAVDLIVSNWMNVRFVGANEIMNKHEDVALWLAEQEGKFRIYSPSYSVPQQVAVVHGLELVDGIDPMQIASYVQFMNVAMGVPDQGYSVTIPPFANGNPEIDNRGYIPDAELLGYLNVRYITAEYDLPETSHFLFRTQIGSTRIYENTLFMPRAWLQSGTHLVNTSITPITELVWRPNRIEMKAEGPGLLVLSEIAYPGWMVRVDGEKRAIQMVDDILRGVWLDEGYHTVSFYYFPASIYIGILVGLVCWGMMVVLFLKNTKMQNP